VGSKAEYCQRNPSHVARNKKVYKKLKQTNASAHLVRYRLRSVKAVQKKPENYGGKDLWKRWVLILVGVKGRGSNRWWERRWWLWWGDMCRMRWSRRRVNWMRLTERRIELIQQERWWISERVVGDL